MSNINCTESGCEFMEDGKCTLSMITRAGTENAACPYYREGTGG